MPTIPVRNLQKELNKMNPVADHAKLGDILNDLITKHNAVCAKLDADAGVTDTNFTALHAVTTLANRSTTL